MSVPNDIRLSVVIPAYNERDNIERTLRQCHEALTRLCREFEILVVNDCSTDGTGELAEDLARQLPGVRVIHNPRNLRQGASLIRGFQSARMDWVTHNAMDYPFHLEDLERVFPLLAQHEVVAIARDQRPDSNLYRRFLTSVNLFLLRNFFGLRLKDYNFVQVYRRDVLQSLDFSATSTGFLTPSLLFQAHDRGCRIAEITLPYWPRERGVARSGNWKVLRDTLRDLLKFWWRRQFQSPSRAPAKHTTDHPSG